MSDSYENVKNWITSSGLIILNSNDKYYGGVYSYFDQNNEEYSFLYPEITGYSASASSFLYLKEKNDSFLRLAEANSNWLISIFETYGSIIQGLSNEEVRKNFAYTFDAAICAKGLLDTYNITNSSKFLDYSKKLLDWIIPAIENDGTIKPFMDMTTKKFTENDDVWYKKKGNLHIKVAIPFAQLYDVTHEENFLKIAINICNAYTKFIRSDGSLTLHEDEDTINLHTQSYALEGLLFTYSITENSEYFDCCKKCLEWCSKKIEDDGSINLWFNSRHKSKAIYPVAQIIRLMILTDKLENSQQFKSEIKKLISFTQTLQAKNSDKRINGGFYEEYYKTMFGWKKRQKLNSWGSLFALQALYWNDNYNKIDFKKEINLLY